MRRPDPSPDDIIGLIQGIAPEFPTASARVLERVLLGMEPAGELRDRLETLDQLASWLREPGDFELPDTALVTGRSEAGRVWLLIQTLRTSDIWRNALGRLVAGVITDTSSLRLFARTGLPSELRILSEFSNRVLRRVLPSPPEYACLDALVARLFPNEASLRWLEVTPPQLVGELFEVMLDVPAGTDARARVLNEVADAAAMLAVRAAALGLDEDIRSRSAVPTLRVSPFVAISRACTQLLQLRQYGAQGDIDALRDEAARSLLEARAQYGRVLANHEQGGVSIDLVFRLELLGRLLDRIDALLNVLDGPRGDLPAHRARNVRFFRELVSQDLADRSIVSLLQTNSRLLARRIVERAGETGEHYITSTRAEWFAMLGSAAGGGIITAGTAALKFMIGWGHLPYFFQAAFYASIYAGSFLLLQALGFTLATKQPSMTAAALAATIDGSNQQHLDGLVDQIARTARSQLAAVIGNLGLVIPACLAIHFGWILLHGHPFLDVHTAADTIDSLNPWHSLALFYGALTGVLLWFSSVIGGWVENWTAVHQLPMAIEHHRRLIRVLGAPRARYVARMFARHVSALGSNISLGILLGVTPIMGKFFGAPIDVRHVTLSTGAWTLGGAAIGPQVIFARPFQEAFIGILMIGALNFGVSFALALAVALRSRNVPARQLVVLLRAVLSRMARRPLSFLFPPADAMPSETGAH